jgi:hypothetical protein
LIPYFFKKWGISQVGFFLDDLTTEGTEGAEEEKREMNNIKKAIIVERQAIYMC